MAPRIDPRNWLPLIFVPILAIACGGPSANPVSPVPSGPTTPEETVIVASDPAVDERTDPEAPELDAPVWNHADAKVPVSPDDPSWGSPLAPVTLVVFTDLECPFCLRLEGALDVLKSDYGPERLRIVFKHNPLPFHKHAKSAAIAAAAVHHLGGSDAFFRFVQIVFMNQKSIDAHNLETWAVRVGVAVHAYRDALRDPRHAAKVDSDMALAVQLGIRGTPHSLVNGRSVNGAQPVAKFREVIGEEIGRAKQLIENGVPAERIYIAATNDNWRAPEPRSKRTEPTADTTVWKVPIGRSPARGARNALVTIVGFSDFQCPFCKRVEPTLDDILQRYPNDVRVVWKDRPLPFHKRAMPAAAFARAARAQRGDTGFWAAHDKLFANQPNFEDADLERYAQELKLNVFLVKRALAANTNKAGIEADTNLADTLKASGTPHFFINGRRIVGAQPIEKFVALIEQELAKARAMVAAGTPRSVVYAHLQKDAKVPPPPPPPERKTVPAPNATQPYRGGRFAPIVIQVFSDFECPFCSRVEPTLDVIAAKYGNRVKIVWRHLPLPFHRNAQLAAEASVEVFKQKGNPGFWAYHKKLFENQKALDRASLESYAAALGVNMAAFRQALDQRTHRAAVEADAKIAKDAGIRGTPGSVVNGYFVSGAQPLANFEKVIEFAERHP
jgi:protein-disulfide isomerase